MSGVISDDGRCGPYALGHRTHHALEARAEGHLGVYIELYETYDGLVSEPALEMPISDARDQFADVVNRAAYGGEITYVTRRGRRLAAVVPAAHVAAEAAAAGEAATAEACRKLWQSVAHAEDETRAEVRGVIDQLMEVAEDFADIAAADLAWSEVAAGAETTSLEDLAAESGR